MRTPFWRMISINSSGGTIEAIPPAPYKFDSFTYDKAVSPIIAERVDGGDATPSTLVSLRLLSWPRTSTRTAPIPPSLCGGKHW